MSKLLEGVVCGRTTALRYSGELDATATAMEQQLSRLINSMRFLEWKPAQTPGQGCQLFTMCCDALQRFMRELYTRLATLTYKTGYHYFAGTSIAEFEQ